MILMTPLPRMPFLFLEVSPVEDVDVPVQAVTARTLAEASTSPTGSRRGTAWKMLFQMPHRLEPASSAEARCAGCGASIRPTERRLPTFCVFCEARAQWRRQEDVAWARAFRDWEDDGGRAAAEDKARTEIRHAARAGQRNECWTTLRSTG